MALWKASPEQQTGTKDDLRVTFVDMIGSKSGRGCVWDDLHLCPGDWCVGDGRVEGSDGLSLPACFRPQGHIN